MEYDINKVSPRPWIKETRKVYTVYKPKGEEPYDDVYAIWSKEGEARPICRDWKGGVWWRNPIDSAHAVHCANVHDDLVAALDEMVEMSKTLSDHDPRDFEIMHKAEAVLARAWGDVK